MIAPRITRASRFSADCETRVPSRTGKLSRIRPVRRASTIARAGSPRRAGSVADIRTPTIVAEVTSRRRSGNRGSAERAIANQAAARRNSEATISAVAAMTHERSERTIDWTTLSRPIRLAAITLSPAPSSAGDAEADPARDAGPRAHGAGRRRVERRQPAGGPRRRSRRSGPGRRGAAAPATPGSGAGAAITSS